MIFFLFVWTLRAISIAFSHFPVGVGRPFQFPTEASHGVLIVNFDVPRPRSFGRL